MLRDRQAPEVPHPEAVPHEDHGLLYAHSIVPEPLVLGHEGPRVGSAPKHVGGFFIGVGCGYGFRDPGCGVVPMHIIPPFPREPRRDPTDEKQRSMSRAIQPRGSSVLGAYECAPFAPCANRCFPLCSYCCMTGDRADLLPRVGAEGTGWWRCAKNERRSSFRWWTYWSRSRKRS